MHLAQDNDVVYTLTPDRSDQPFGKAVLPGRGWRGRLVPDAHGAQSACDDAAIDPIPIADQVTRSLIPRKCLRYLTCNPFCRRICCDVDPDQVSAVEPDDDEGIEQVETDSWNNEQVQDPCAFCCDLCCICGNIAYPNLAAYPRKVPLRLSAHALSIWKPRRASWACLLSGRRWPMNKARLIIA